MVQIIPANPSFKTLLAQHLGQALGDVGQGLQQRGQNRQAQSFLGNILGQQGAQPNNTVQQDNNLERPTSPANQPEPPHISSQQLAAAASSNNPQVKAAFPAIKAIYEQQQSRQIAKEKESSRQSFAREQSAEPKLQELGEKLKSYEKEDLRFSRLEKLFAPELEEKFPSNVAVGLFTKDGELRPTAQALLSEEAQEAVKLITDEIKGAKDTFGARVTNFDATTYLKTLPSLLNTPDGRRKVLKDLQIMNQINREETSGVLDIIDEFGGPQNISISKAERLFKKRFEPKLKELKEKFVNPSKKIKMVSPSGEIGEVDSENAELAKSKGYRPYAG